jgi:trimethylamine-N-oxide reductase (cytochrome c)
MRQVIQPYGESLDDFEIFRRLGDLLGVGLQFTGVEMSDDGLQVSGPRTAMQILKQAYASSDASVPFEEFWEKGVVRLEVPEAMCRWVLHGDFHADPVKNPLPTRSGRIELYSETIDSFEIADCPPMPKFLEPVEYLGNARPGQVHVLNPHPFNRLHSQMANADIRKYDNVQGRQHVRISVEDAAANGIKDGDLVELHNDRGALIAGARVTDKIMKGVVSLEEGNWVQFDSRGRCNSGSINVLTTSIASSGLSQATSANTCIASLKECDDAESENRAFEPPIIERGKELALNFGTVSFSERATRLRGKRLARMSAGERLFYERCTLCHVPQEPGDFTKKQWLDTSKVMFQRANLNEAEKDTVMKFLEANARDAGGR